MTNNQNQLNHSAPPKKRNTTASEFPHQLSRLNIRTDFICPLIIPKICDKLSTKTKKGNIDLSTNNSTSFSTKS